MPLGSLIRGATSLWEGRQNRKSSEKQFNAQMDQSIQRRVADAKKAGVHPLFALGGNVGASPTVSGGSSGVAAAGEAVAQGYEQWNRNKGNKAAQEKADQLLSAQIHQANASAGRDAAEAALLDSNRALAEQKLYGTGRDSSPQHVAPRYMGPTGGSSPVVEYVKPEIPYNQGDDTTTAAGTGPLWVEKWDTPTRTIHVPQEDTNLDFIANVGGAWKMGINRARDSRVNYHRDYYRLWNPRTQKWETHAPKKRKRSQKARKRYRTGR